ncbi:MAG: GxxExxY protein [Acidiferrobacterales bacterium]
MELNDITESIIGAAIDVHKEIGPGLLESIYQKCLVHELKLRGLNIETEVSIPIQYKDLELKDACRADMLVENKVIVELKAVDNMHSVYTAQLLSYLKMSSLSLGLLINFNVSRLAEGVKRVVNNY